MKPIYLIAIAIWSFVLICVSINAGYNVGVQECEQIIEDRDAEWQQLWDDREAEYAGLLDDLERTITTAIEDRDAEWELILRQAIESRDAEWEQAIKQSNDEEALNLIMEILPYVLI